MFPASSWSSRATASADSIAAWPNAVASGLGATMIRTSASDLILMACWLAASGRITVTLPW